MKKQLTAAVAALVLASGLTGCTIKSPETVGDIGGVNIPAGVYLLEQYNAYQSAKGMTSDSDVLNATLTLEDGTEQKGSDYVTAETLKNLEYYAAVAVKFDEMGGELTEESKNLASQQAESLWTNYKDTLTANGIGRASVDEYMSNAVKSTQLLTMIYGKDGTEPVSDDDLWAYVNENFRLGQYVMMPLLDYTTYSTVDDEKKAQIMEAAEGIKAAIEGGASVTDAASPYLAQVMSLVGQTYTDDMISNFVGGSLYTPSTSDSFGEQLSAGIAASQPGTVNILESDNVLMVFNCQPIEGNYSMDVLRNSALAEMKGGSLDEQYAAEGAALPHNLNSKAMSQYSQKKIK